MTNLKSRLIFIMHDRDRLSAGLSFLSLYLKFFIFVSCFTFFITNNHTIKKKSDRPLAAKKGDRYFFKKIPNRSILLWGE